MDNEKYRAILLGCAIGDTLGMPVEGWKREQIRKYVGKITEPIEPVLIYESASECKLKREDEFGRLKYFGKDLRKGDYTDDTILTLAIAESIAQKRDLDLNDVAQKHVKEYESRLRDDGSVIGGFGKTTMDAIQNLRKGISPLHSGVIGGPGNAPCMKIAPIGMYMDSLSKYQEGIQFAYNVGKMTHLDPRSLVSGVVQAHAIYLLLQDVSRNEFLHSIEAICEEHELPLTGEFSMHEKGTLSARLSWIENNKDSSDEYAFKVLGNNSLVFRSYPFALFMFQKFWDNPLEGLIETVNFGGDCDTTGAIYGALAGAKHGIDIFPQDWINLLQDKDRIIKAADSIHALQHF